MTTNDRENRSISVFLDSSKQVASNPHFEYPLICFCFFCVSVMFVALIFDREMFSSRSTGYLGKQFVVRCGINGDIL